MNLRAACSASGSASSIEAEVSIIDPDGERQVLDVLEALDLLRHAILEDLEVEACRKVTGRPLSVTVV